jgi:hypothetical protein
VLCRLGAVPSAGRSFAAAAVLEKLERQTLQPRRVPAAHSPWDATQLAEGLRRMKPPVKRLTGQKAARVERLPAWVPPG